MDRTAAEHFAENWVAAWNSHDLPRVLEHYEEDFEMSSPLIVHIAGEPSGKLRGKRAIGEYWRKALAAVPHLRFELLCALAGVDSVVVHYRGHRGLCAEVMRIGASGKVISASAHYQDP
jgi:ketosteroid isomerase-like protein